MSTQDIIEVEMLPVHISRYPTDDFVAVRRSALSKLLAEIQRLRVENKQLQSNLYFGLGT